MVFTASRDSTGNLDERNVNVWNLSSREVLAKTMTQRKSKGMEGTENRQTESRPYLWIYRDGIKLKRALVSSLNESPVFRFWHSSVGPDQKESDLKKDCMKFMLIVGYLFTPRFHMLGATVSSFDHPLPLPRGRGIWRLGQIELVFCPWLYFFTTYASWNEQAIWGRQELWSCQSEIHARERRRQAFIPCHRLRALMDPDPRSLKRRKTSVRQSLPCNSKSNRTIRRRLSS